MATSIQNLPESTSSIFHKLAKGDFICSNSDSGEEKRLFNDLEEHFENLATFYKVLGYDLQQAQGFYYLSRKEDNAKLIDKVTAAQRLIFYLDVLKTYDNLIGPGTVISSHNLTVMERQNQLLAQKIERLKRFEQKKNRAAEESKKPISAMLEKLEKDGYLEKMNSNQDEQRYKVLDSFRYLENLVASIQIFED